MSLKIADIGTAYVPKDISFIVNNKSSGRTLLPSDFPEVRLFALLKWKFGKPNGMFTSLGKPGGDPDGPFKWDFIFNPYKYLTISVIRIVPGIEIWWWGNELKESEILTYLQNNMKKYSDEIDKSIDELESYTLILNPYVRHRSIVRFANKELQSINPIMPDPLPSVANSKKEIKKYGKKFSIFMERVEQQASLIMLVVLESAFMSEAYLNLLYAILIREEIRNQKHIFEETLLRKWHSKLERLPIDCRYTIPKIDLGDVRVRDAKKMFNLRNRIAHSYPDKKNMMVGQMWYQDRVPVLPIAEPFYKFTIALHNQLPSLADAKFCVKAAERFINFLSESIIRTVVDEVKFITEINPIGFNETKHMFGVPFSDHVILFAGGHK